ncbi:Cysteine protease atg4 [Rhodosporidiobolus nylandii]
MSPFSRRTNPPQTDTAAPPPPPSRIPTSRSTSSLALFRTRSRGNDQDEFGAGAGAAASPPHEEQTIRAVPRRARRKEKERRRAAEADDHEDEVLLMNGRVSASSPPSHHGPNKLQKWLSRSSTSSSTASSDPAGSPPPPPAPRPHRPPPPQTRTARSRSIGSLNLLSNALHPSPPSTKSRSGRPSTADSSPSPSRANAPVPAPAPQAPTIEISSSPSITAFSASSPSPSSSPALTSSPSASYSSSPTDTRSPPPRADENPLRRGSVASTGTSSTHSSLRSFAGLSLKPGSGSRRRQRKPRQSTDEVLDEWATADLSEGDEDGRLISEEMVRAASRTSTSSTSALASVAGPAQDGAAGKAGGGVLAKSLRRTRSGLKLFQRGREESAQSGQSGSTQSEGVYGAGSAGAAGASNASLLDASASTTFASMSPTPTSAVFPSSTSSSPHPPPHHTPLATSQNGGVGGRIGGWFSSMLHGPSSTHLPLPEDESAAPVSLSPEKTRRAAPAPASPGAALRAVVGTGATGSPQKKGSSSSLPGSAPGPGRLGAFDRILDRAAAYFFDADARPDEKEAGEDIWVLGVRHAGLGPAAVAAEKEGAQERPDEGGDEQGKKRRSLPSLGRKSRSPVKARKVPPPPPVPALPVAPASADPFLEPSTSTASMTPSPTPSPAASDIHLPLPASSASTTSATSASSASPSLATPGLPLPLTVHGWPTPFYHDFHSRIALTYRSGFPLVLCDPPPSSQGAVAGVLSSLGASIGRGGRPQHAEEGRGLSSDTGWGCMLRTGQSLLANALGVVHLGRDWRRPLPSSSFQPSSGSSSSAHLPTPAPPPVPSAATYARLLALFLDAPIPLSPFSVHAFAAQGKLLGKAPGEWFGPSTAAGAIKALVNAYEPAGLRVVSCVDGAVYETEVERESRGPRGVGEKWSTPVLILVNVRLGIDGVNPIYYEAIKGIFRLPHSVGIAGGRPSSSYYFVGAQSNSLFYIDPHHPRPAVPVVAAPREVEDAAGRVPLAGSPLFAPAKHEEREREPRRRVDTQETARPPPGAISESFVTVSPSSPPCSSSSQPSSPAPDLYAADRAHLDAFLLSAYPDAAWQTYHAEKGEEDWREFKRGVEELFRSSAPIFSIATSPPSWMRRSTSTAAAPPVNPSTTNSTAPAGADDSFSDVDAFDSTHPAEVEEDGESSTGFSEPDDWELDSTDGLSASPSPSRASGFPSTLGSAEHVGGAKEKKRDAVNDGWEDEDSSPSRGAASLASAPASAGSNSDEAAQAPSSSLPAVAVEVEKLEEEPVVVSEQSKGEEKGGGLEADGWEGV